MEKDQEKFTDDLGKTVNKVVEDEKTQTNTNDLQDKWNQIQDEYLTQNPDLEMDDLYFEGGGFNRVLEKISEQTGKSIDDVKKEIKEW